MTAQNLSIFSRLSAIHQKMETIENRILFELKNDQEISKKESELRDYISYAINQINREI